MCSSFSTYMLFHIQLLTPYMYVCKRYMYICVYV